ncbi:thiamine pyrophosphate-dependent enzyme [Streptomyces sp. INA 01156]
MPSGSSSAGSVSRCSPRSTARASSPRSAPASPGGRVEGRQARERVHQRLRGRALRGFQDGRQVDPPVRVAVARPVPRPDRRRPGDRGRRPGARLPAARGHRRRPQAALRRVGGVVLQRPPSVDHHRRRLVEDRHRLLGGDGQRGAVRPGRLRRRGQRRERLVRRAAAPGAAAAAHHPRGTGSLGYAIPASVGAAVARPDATVWTLVGDGGLTMSIGELETIARLGLNVKITVLDNGRLNLIDQHAIHRHGAAAVSRDFHRIDWLPLCAAIGLPVMACDDPDRDASEIASFFSRQGRPSSCSTRRSTKSRRTWQ